MAAAGDQVLATEAADPAPRGGRREAGGFGQLGGRDRAAFEAAGEQFHQQRPDGIALPFGDAFMPQAPGRDYRADLGGGEFGPLLFGEPPKLFGSDRYVPVTERPKRSGLRRRAGLGYR